MLVNSVFALMAYHSKLWL